MQLAVLSLLAFLFFENWLAINSYNKYVVTLHILRTTLENFTVI